MVVTCLLCGGVTYKGRRSNFIKVHGGYRHEDVKLCNLIRILVSRPIPLEDLIGL